MERRRFLYAGAGAAAAATLAARSISGQESRNPRTTEPLGGEFLTVPNIHDARMIPRVVHAGQLRGEMLYRQLGKTGVEVSAIGLGGSHIGKQSLTDDEAIRIIHQAIDRGINFMDNSWDYNDGRSEEIMGKALNQGGYRTKTFLMTKVDGRTKQEAQKQIDQSLRRLQTDHLDLLQHHETIRFEDPDRIFAHEGSMEAVIEARQSGKVRFIGFTGHKDPHIHLYMLDVAKSHGFRFDTAQMPLNVMDAHFRSFAQLVVPRLVDEGTGVLAMKCFGGADGVILKSMAVEPMECLHYSLNLPVSVVITGIDNQKVLDQAFAAARQFRVMDEEQVSALIAKTEKAALTGEFELFKTSSHFDSTALHPQWLGGQPAIEEHLIPRQSG